VAIDLPRIGAGERHRTRDDRLQHGREVEGRAHGLPDLLERGQLLDRARELRGPRAQFLEEARVLDRDHGLIGEGGQ